MRKSLLFLFLLAFLYSNAQQQRVYEQRTYEYQRLHFGVEAGFENFIGDNVKPSAIRESQSYVHDDFSYQHGFMYDYQDFTRYYFGVKSEYSLSHRFAVAAGLRFAFGKSSLTSDRDNFLWKVHESETSSDYVKIKSIRQNVYNLGIPLELKFFPGQSDLLVRQYIKVGAVFNFAFAQDVSLDFANKSMEKYGSDVKGQFEKPDFFNGEAFIALGLKFGRMRNPFGSLEFQVPVQFSNRTRLSSLFELDENVGVALQANFYIPTGKRTLSYQYKVRK
jgi:hypothetical protein